jgi:periplasmic copper chaperone A
MKTRLAFLFALCGLLADTAHAMEIVVTDAWTRASAPGQTVAGVYFSVQSDVDAALVGAETAAADVGELHFMSVEDGVMRMRAVPRVALPAGTRVQFKSGGYHVMLFDLQQPLEPGDEIILLLVIEDGAGRNSRIKVPVRVRNLDGSKAQHHH